MVALDIEGVGASWEQQSLFVATLCDKVLELVVWV